MYLLNAQQMAAMDRYTIETLGIPGILLMENAGMAVVREINARFDNSTPVSILCGSGNNGGDGFVIARHLHLQGYPVTVFHGGLPQTNDSLMNFRLIEGLGVSMFPLEHFLETDPVLVIDALFGTGLSRPLEGLNAELLAKASEAPFRIAVDISSGVCSSTGQILGVAFEADLTITMEYPKRGHFLSPGAEFTGELVVAPIGISPQGLPGQAPRLLSSLEPKIPHRSILAHKGSCGHVLCVGGSTGKAGAIRLGAKAALECGAGLVTVASQKETVRSLQISEPEIMCLELPEENSGALRELFEFPADAMIIGPGGGRQLSNLLFYRDLLLSAECPIVLDADGLYCEEAERDMVLGILRKRKSPTILTPHPKEFERLTGISTKSLEPRKLDAVREWAEELDCCIVLKGTRTTIASAQGQVLLLDAPNPALAKGGSGDVLAGIIGSLLAQGFDIFEAAVEGCKIHALAGKIMQQQYGNHSGGPMKLISHLSEIFKEYTDENYYQNQ